MVATSFVPQDVLQCCGDGRGSQCCDHGSDCQCCGDGRGSQCCGDGSDCQCCDDGRVYCSAVTMVVMVMVVSPMVVLMVMVEVVGDNGVSMVVIVSAVTMEGCIAVLWLMVEVVMVWPS